MTTTGPAGHQTDTSAGAQQENTREECAAIAKTGTGKYAPVIEALRAQIGNGEVQPGDWLPSEAQLMNEYGVSRYSAREAIRRLAGEGLIVVVDGKGSYVRARQRASHADLRAIHQTTQVRRGGKGGRTEH